MDGCTSLMLPWPLLLFNSEESSWLLLCSVLLLCLITTMPGTTSSITSRKLPVSVPSTQTKDTSTLSLPTSTSIWRCSTSACSLLPSLFTTMVSTTTGDSNSRENKPLVTRETKKTEVPTPELTIKSLLTLVVLPSPLWTLRALASYPSLRTTLPTTSALDGNEMLHPIFSFKELLW